jgi:hypothetical protein
LRASPSSQTVAAGKSGAFTIATALVRGSKETIHFTIADLPNGVTALFDPASVVTGGSTKLTLTAAPSAPRTNAVVKVTGQGTTTHTIGPALTITR